MTTIFDNVNIDGLRLGPVRSSKGSSSCKMVNILTETGDKLKIQTPVLRIPWNVTARQMNEEQNCSASMALSLDTADENGAKFLDFLQRFDNKVKSLLSEKSSELGKKEGAIEFEFKDSFKESKNGQYPSTFLPKIWLKTREGGSPKNLDDVTLDIKVFDMDLNKIKPSALTRSAPCAILVSPSYAWSSGLGSGITWTCSEAVVKPIEVEECGFNLDSSFDKYKSEPKKRKVDTGSVSEHSEVYDEEEEEF